MSRRKNKSKNIRDGTVLQTRDEYLASGRNYGGKPSDKGKGLNRPTIVVASSRNNHVAVVKITSSPKATPLKDGHKGRKSGYKPIVETNNSRGKPLRINANIKPNKPAEHISKRDLKLIQQDCFKNTRSKTRTNNRNAVRQMKGRAPKK